MTETPLMDIVVSDLLAVGIAQFSLSPRLRRVWQAGCSHQRIAVRMAVLLKGIAHLRVIREHILRHELSVVAHLAPPLNQFKLQYIAIFLF